MNVLLKRYSKIIIFAFVVVGLAIIISSSLAQAKENEKLFKLKRTFNLHTKTTLRMYSLYQLIIHLYLNNTLLFN